MNKYPQGPGNYSLTLPWKTGQSLRRDTRKKIDAVKIHQCGKSWMSSVRSKCPNHKLLLETWRPFIIGINGRTAWRVKLCVFFSRNTIYLAALGYFFKSNSSKLKTHEGLLKLCRSFLPNICWMKKVGSCWSKRLHILQTHLLQKSHLLSRTCFAYHSAWYIPIRWPGFIILTFREWKTQWSHSLPLNVQPGQNQLVSHDLPCHWLYSQLLSPGGFLS